MSKFQIPNKRISQSPLKDGFLDDIDKMSHDDLKLVTRQCVCNLHKATNLITNFENLNFDCNHVHYDNGKKKILDDYKDLIFKIKQCCLNCKPSNPTKANELVFINDSPNHHKNKKDNVAIDKESFVEHSSSKPCKSLDSSIFKKFVDTDEDILAYHQKLNRTLSKAVDDLQEKLKIRSQQWQVTLNLYLKEKYEHGEGLTTLEKIAKEKYKTFHQETRKKAMQEIKGKLEKDSCVII